MPDCWDTSVLKSTGPKVLKELRFFNISFSTFRTSSIFLSSFQQTASSSSPITINWSSENNKLYNNIQNQVGQRYLFCKWVLGGQRVQFNQVYYGEIYLTGALTLRRLRVAQLQTFSSPMIYKNDSFSHRNGLLIKSDSIYYRQSSVSIHFLSLLNLTEFVRNEFQYLSLTLKNEIFFFLIYILSFRQININYF